MTAVPARLWVLVALGALACGRARAEDAPAPAPVALAPSVALSSAPPAPSAALAPALPQKPEPELTPAEHDRALLPCASGRALCEPMHPLIARGVLERAEKYLSQCKLCRHRDLVRATVLRTRSVVDREARERRRREAKDCRSSDDVAILVSPDSVIVGESARVIVASEQPLAGKLEIVDERGEPVAIEREQAGGGPPHFRLLSLGALGAGKHRVVLRDGDTIGACKRFEVAKQRRMRFRKGGVWHSPEGWNRNAENLYSAWIATAFDAPEGKRWKGIGEVTTDRGRNFLHNHLGLGEDNQPKTLGLRPDCADAPYVFRAYFAWKLGLPFGRHICRFGEIDGPPRCREWATNTMPEPDPESEELEPLTAWDFRNYVEQLIDDVNARTLRTALADDATDLYPVALSREHLRPGVVYSDAYGHTLTLVKWIAQTPTEPGKLLAVDAQPDGTLGIRRFWRGNFVFVDRHPIGGFGFKAFRPIVADEDGLRLLDNSEIAVAHGYGGFSLAQARQGSADFYATMSRLVSPNPPPPEQELDDLVGALIAQLERRVLEVATAEEIVSERKTPIEMPAGREIFRTTGAWEAVSTPCRDLRLLVGIDALLAFPDEAARVNPAVSSEALRKRLAQRAAERFVEYQRSDGSRWRLTLSEIIQRKRHFEMAYNPNDCAELRWGAPEGSAEAEPCSRRAPSAQRRGMQQMRHWFVKRYSCG